MKKLLSLFIITLALLFSNETKAQYFHEFGGSIGPSAILGDWSRSNELSSYLGYNGGSVSFLHNLHFIRQRSSVRSNLSFSYNTMKHEKAEWIQGEGEKNKQLAGMKGETMLINLGSRYEYNFMDFGLYYPRNHWTPYVAAGINLTYAMPNVTTTYGNGDIKDEANLHPIYHNGGVITDPVFSAALKGALGIKFKLSRQLWFFGEVELSRYFTDDIDGLEPGPSTSVDYTNALNFGLMYTLY